MKSGYGYRTMTICRACYDIYDELIHLATLNALKFHEQIMSWTICLLKLT